MKNHLIFCPKCSCYVGAWDKGDYFLCAHNEKHKIVKEEVKNDKKRSKNKNNN